MQVVGITTQQEFWVASKDRKFRMNEMLIVEDNFQGGLIGEVVETSSYNRYIPFSVNNAVVDSTVLKSLEMLGYDINADTIHIARVRLMVEATYPVETGANVRCPNFKEVEKYVFPQNAYKGLVIGAIKSTEGIYEEMENAFKDILYTYKDGVVQEQKEVPFIFDIHLMSQYPHIGVFGGSGSGKSFAVRVLLEELMKHKIPAVVFDPHFEMDFGTMANLGGEAGLSNFSDSYKCLKVGYNVGVNFTTLSTGDLKNLLSASGALSDAMSMVIDILHKRKDSFNSFSERVDLLCEGLELGKSRIQEIIGSSNNRYERVRLEQMLDIVNEYANQVPLLSIKGIAWRLKRLQKEGIFNSDITPVEDGLRKGKLVVIQGGARLLQVFASYILNNLYQRRRTYRDFSLKRSAMDYFPPFMLVTDEAHMLAPKGYDTPAKSIMKEIAQEGRKYGVFLVLATQRPSLLDETVTAQLNSKFIFRTVRASDISIIKEETDLTAEEAKRLPYLCSGDAFFSSAIMGRTISIRIRAAMTESPHFRNPFDELKEVRRAGEQEVMRVIRNKLPIVETSLLATVNEIFEETGVSLEQMELKQRLDQMVMEGKLIRKKTPFGFMYEENIEIKL